MRATIVDPAAALPIAPFDYPGTPVISAWEPLEWPEYGSAPKPDPEEPPSSPDPADESARAALEQRLQDECERSFDAGRRQGYSEGLNTERDDRAEDREFLAAQIESMNRTADADRTRYFAAVEQEAVRLSLAIAARILRREAQMDPLLLLGAVRVALGQLASSTRVRLRVPASDLQLWTEAVALLPRRDIQIEVLPGDHLLLGDCAIETELGTADLGVRAQLTEIERGFFDRAGAPAPQTSEPRP